MPNLRTQLVNCEKEINRIEQRKIYHQETLKKLDDQKTLAQYRMNYLQRRVNEK